MRVGRTRYGKAVPIQTDAWLLTQRTYDKVGIRTQKASASLKLLFFAEALLLTLPLPL